MRFVATEIPGLIVVEPDVHTDSRGFFLETYHRGKYAEGGIVADFVQDNHSRSCRGALRGLHFQINHPQAKLLRVIRGEAFDVAVDVRRDSPTFAKWFGVTLSADNYRQLFVPAGFAHGFCALSETVEIEYKCDAFYDPSDEISILWNDATIGIEWPIENPSLSQRDREAISIKDLLEKHYN